MRIRFKPGDVVWYLTRTHYDNYVIIAATVVSVTIDEKHMNTKSVKVGISYVDYDESIRSTNVAQGELFKTWQLAVKHLNQNGG